MIKETTFFISKKDITTAIQSIPNFDFRINFNEPTGRFFYDTWKIKKEYEGTIWESILHSLPVMYGEARLIKLNPGTCYKSHADIDDRFHLTLTGQQSFLIDLDNQKMYQTNKIGYWYEMDTSFRHTAANFGSVDRFQIVVRKLLNDNNLKSPVCVKIKEKENDPEQFSRYIFDDFISPWLNKLSKNGLISNVEPLASSIKFNIEKKYINELKKIILKTGLILEYGN